jgi:hypothetical protein
MLAAMPSQVLPGISAGDLDQIEAKMMRDHDQGHSGSG